MTLQMAWTVVAATVSIGWIIATVIYRLYFHPLARFPGPKLAAVTFLYEQYFDIWKSGAYTFKLKDLHRQYGALIPISLSIMTPNLSTHRTGCTTEPRRFAL